MTALNETMRAIVWQGQPFNISVLDVPTLTIINQTVAVARFPPYSFKNGYRFLHVLNPAMNILHKDLSYSGLTPLPMKNPEF